MAAQGTACKVVPTLKLKTEPQQSQKIRLFAYIRSCTGSFSVYDVVIIFDKGKMLLLVLAWIIRGRGTVARGEETRGGEGSR